MRAVVPLAIALALGGAARAEEGPTGHYLAGTVADFIDAVPPKGTVVLRASVLRYSGSNTVEPMPIAGLTTSDVRATLWMYALSATLRPNYDLANNLAWAASITIPIVSLAVDANLHLPGGVIPRSQDTTGFGDVLVTPLIFNYSFTPTLSANARVALYVPTGRYQTDRIANTGKNFWTIEPILGVAYFGKETGLEATIYGGLDVNTKNKSTEYQTGTIVHGDATLALHVSLKSGVYGLGGTGFWYQQVSADSGLGATLGANEARAGGAGPVISYVTRVRAFPVAFDLKWMHDFAVQRRLDGQHWFLKAAATF